MMSTAVMSTTVMSTTMMSTTMMSTAVMSTAPPTAMWVTGPIHSTIRTVTATSTTSGPSPRQNIVTPLGSIVMIHYHGIVTLSLLENSFCASVECVITVVHLRIRQPVMLLFLSNVTRFVVVHPVLTI